MIGLRPVVQPLPTLHPDRYTPGDTAPAADLTPGARNHFDGSTVPASPDTSSGAAQTPRKTTPPNTPTGPRN